MVPKLVDFQILLNRKKEVVKPTSYGHLLSIFLAQFGVN